MSICDSLFAGLREGGRRRDSLFELPQASRDDVAALIKDLAADLRRANPEKVRLALARIFDGIVIKPLRGAWKNGWTLEMRTRP